MTLHCHTCFESAAEVFPDKGAYFHAFALLNHTAYPLECGEVVQQQLREYRDGKCNCPNCVEVAPDPGSTPLPDYRRPDKRRRLSMVGAKPNPSYAQADLIRYISQYPDRIGWPCYQHKARVKAHGVRPSKATVRVVLHNAWATWHEHDCGCCFLEPTTRGLTAKTP